MGIQLKSCTDSNLRKNCLQFREILSSITEWIHIGKYSLHPGPKSQEDALILCSSIGKQLVEPRSVDTNTEIIALAKLTISGKGVWIGIDDKSHEGYYRYSSDASSVGYTNWASGQPNNYNDQDCVLLWTEKDFKWGDEHCSSIQASFICEQKPGK